MEQLQAVGEQLEALGELAQSDSAKAALAAAIEAFKAFASEVGGGEEAEEAAPVPVEAGTKGVPMSHGRPA